MSLRERKLSQLPPLLLLGLVLFFGVQLVYHHQNRQASVASFSQLKAPLDVEFYQSISLGSGQLMSYLLTIGLQLHDNQKGQHISYSHLDYQRLSDWLLTLYRLNPESEYPGFLAARVYSQVRSETQIRQMVAVISELFRLNPAQHWRRMTEACLLLKHQLNDLPAALEVAERIAALPGTIKIPFWARDMKLVLLDELNELESAQLLISSMLQSGEIEDRDEIRFLQSRLLKIQQSLLKSKQKP